MLKPTTFDWITVAAVLLGPVLALSTQRILDRLREKRERRVRLFMELMTTRATQLSPQHVNALNSIDVVFNARGDKRIRLAWSAFLDHIQTDGAQSTWQDRYNDLKVDLLREIGAKVGYTLTTDYLKRQVYYPRAFGDVEADNLKLRKLLTEVITPDGLKVQIAQALSSQTETMTHFSVANGHDN